MYTSSILERGLKIEGGEEMREIGRERDGERERERGGGGGAF